MSGQRAGGRRDRGPSPRLAKPLGNSRSQVRRGRLYAAISAVAWATTGLVQRSVSADTGTQVAGRSLFAFLAIALYVLVAGRRGSAVTWRAIGMHGVIASALIAIASASF